MDLPVYITVRDRVSDLRRLVEWLETAGHQRIIFLDNASTYEPLLEYLENTPHTVMSLDENYGSQSIWAKGLQPQDEYWALTDPDILPIPECPTDAIWVLRELLDRYPNHPKAALGLYLDDVPATMSSLDWEQKLVHPSRLLETGVYDSLADTTLAVYRPGEVFAFEALRTGFPYQAKHHSWYHDHAPTDEERYYLQHAKPGPTFSSWKGALMLEESEEDWNQR